MTPPDHTCTARTLPFSPNGDAVVGPPPKLIKDPGPPQFNPDPGPPKLNPDPGATLPRGKK